MYSVSLLYKLPYCFVSLYEQLQQAGNCDMQVRTSTVIKVNGTEFKDMQSEFLFLYKKHMFLTFSNRTVAMWNFRGELVTTFEEHHFLNPADSSFNNTIYTTSDEDLIISYGKAETNDQQRNGKDLFILST